MSSDSKQMKRQANEEYARRFPKRDRLARKKARSRRVAAREKAWLEHNQ